MIGIMKTAIPGYDQYSPAEALAATAKLGLEACLFSHVLELSADLDRGELRAVREMAAELNLSLAAGVGWINPFHLDRSVQVTALGDGDFLAGLRRVVIAAADIGLTDTFFRISPISDRFDRSVPWREQLVATAALLRRFAPILRDCGSRLLLKTHEEITTFEIVTLVEDIGPDVIGVALDPVNVLVRIEDPVKAAKRVAPYVRQVQLDDAVVRFTEGGIRRVLYPLYQGLIDWPAILSLVSNVPRFIELHRGQFSMPVFDSRWLAAHPDLSLTEFATIMEIAVKAGKIPDPWDQSDPLTRLQPTLHSLRKGRP
jgi:sugar phosphate isomerase/epimerase